MKTYSKLVTKKINQLIIVNNECKATIITRKLSFFYQSRSTNYARCLDSNPFIIIKDSKKIVNLGFSKLCKAVITLDSNNEFVKELIEKKIENERKAIDDEIKRKKIHESNVKNTLAAWDSVKDRFLKKWMEINNGILSIISSEKANQLAWKKQSYIDGGVDIATLVGLIKNYFNKNN